VAREGDPPILPHCQDLVFSTRLSVWPSHPTGHIGFATSAGILKDSETATSQIGRCATHCIHMKIDIQTLNCDNQHHKKQFPIFIFHQSIFFKWGAPLPPAFLLNKNGKKENSIMQKILKTHRLIPRLMVAFLVALLWPAMLLAKDGDLKWKFDAHGGGYSSPAIDTDGTLYIGSSDGYLYAINPNGTMKWRFYTGGNGYQSAAIGGDGTIYIGSGSANTLYALNSDGTQKWYYPTGGISSCPAVSADGTIYLASQNGYLYAFTPDGSLRWRIAIHADQSTPSLGPDGTIYVGSYCNWPDDNYLWAINRNGTVKWQYTANDHIISQPTIGPDGTIYAGDMQGYLHAVNPDGSFNWSYKTTNIFLSSSPSIDPEGVIYIGSNDNHPAQYPEYLHALYPDGSLKWRFQTGTSVDTTPAIGLDGTVYIGSGDNNIYAVNADGTLKWSYATTNYIQSSPAIGEDGTVYIFSNDGYLYAIENTSAGLADSAWPMFGHDARHTGQKPLDDNICWGDINGDDGVDSADLALLAADFGRPDCFSAPYCSGYVNGDIYVDGRDIALLAGEFNRNDCP
jgi:outer membrane protein assembly factor BamB